MTRLPMITTFKAHKERHKVAVYHKRLWQIFYLNPRLHWMRGEKLIGD